MNVILLITDNSSTQIETTKNYCANGYDGEFFSANRNTKKMCNHKFPSIASNLR